MEFVDYLNKVIREATGREEINPVSSPTTNSPIVTGLRFSKYRIVSVQGDIAICTVGENTKQYSINTLERRYDNWRASKMRKRAKELAWDKLSYEAKERDGFR